MSQSDTAQCHELALRLLTQREHSAAELRQKLASRGFTPEIIEPVLQRLVELQLQSDQRFAQAFVRARASRGYGPLRIRLELKQRGVSDYLVGQALSQSEVDWFELAAQQQRKRFGEQPPSDRAAQAKCWRFLQYRGFDSEQAGYALQSLTEST